MDSYDLQARHAPMVFAVLPVIIVALAFAPSLGSAKLQAGSIGLVLLLAVGFVATRFARSAGRARQDQLFALWGGMPTMAMLRFRDERLNPQTKKIYHDRLSSLGGDFPIPNEEDERVDPAAADIKIAAAMDEVRRRVKEKAIKAVHRENINYGAARNAFGLKPFGLGACLIALLALAASILLRGKILITPLDIGDAMAIVLITATWLFACNAAHVLHHAEAYALALFEAIEIVSPGKSNSATRA